MKTFTIIYNSDQVTQLNYSTTNGFIGTVGASGSRDQSKTYNFDQTNYKFYGLYGTDDNFIASLGVIRIDSRCLQTKINELGSSFDWDVSPEEVSAADATADAAESEAVADTTEAGSTEDESSLSLDT